MTAVGSPIESHDHDEAVFIIDGLLALDVDGIRLEIGPGEFFVIAANQPHRTAEGSSGTLLLVDMPE